jgi:hypothetical protein
MATLEVFDRTWKAVGQSGALNTLLINELDFQTFRLQDP